MQAELSEDIHIIGVNDTDYASSNETMTAEGDLPWLQNTESQGAWELWGVTYRDVVVIDRNNELFATYNLTDADLSEEDNYESLRLLLEAAANE